MSPRPKQNASSPEDPEGRPARPQPKPTSGKKKKKQVVRTHTPRPDELSKETFEFIAAVDEYKRRHMRSFLGDEEVLTVLHGMGYRNGDGVPAGPPSEAELEAYGAIRQRYRVERGRLFPTWSELFGLLMELGYRRASKDSAA